MVLVFCRTLDYTYLSTTTSTTPMWGYVRCAIVQIDKKGESEIKIVLNLKILMKTKCKDKRLKTVIFVSC